MRCHLCTPFPKLIPTVLENIFDNHMKTNSVKAATRLIGWHVLQRFDVGIRMHANTYVHIYIYIYIYIHIYIYIYIYI